MTMDRLAERLAEGMPPLRVGKLAELIGFSAEYLRKRIRCGELQTIDMGTEKRIPIHEAQRIAREKHLL